MAGAGGHNNLYVAGLPDGIDDDTFRQLFEGSGNIVSFKCFPEKRCGFVKYVTNEEAQAVVDAMNGFAYGGAQLQVRFAVNDQGAGGGAGKGSSWGGGKAWTPTPQIEEPEVSDNLYIKGLPTGIADEQVKEIFGQYGAIQQLKVLKYDNDSCCLMRMSSVEMATWMVENLNGNIPQGLTTPVSVRFADSPTRKAAKQLGGVGGCPASPVQAAKGKGKGDNDRWSPYGDSWEAGDSGYDDGYGYGKGGGGYDGYDNGMGAKGSKGKGAAPGKGAEVPFGNPNPLPPEVSECVDVVLQNLGGGKGKGKGKRFAPSGDESNLYVKDLPTTADELYMYKVFSPFGALESISVKISNDGSWAIGFVKYQMAVDALKAIQGLTGCLLPDGSMLKVQVKSDTKAGKGA